MHLSRVVRPLALLAGLGWPGVALAAPGAAEAGAAEPSPGAPSPPSGSVPRAAVEGLLVDVARIVDAEESSGWFTDEAAFAEVEPLVLESVCRATPEVRAAALERAREAARAAGDPRARFDAGGRHRTTEVDRALARARELEALDRAVSRAEGECPFWMDPSPGFEGRQTDRNRFTLNLETGGMLQVRHQAGSWTYGGGGAGRLLLGRGFGGAFTLLAGGEFGGGAMLEPSEAGEGTRTQTFVINYFPALPVVLRLRGLAWHFDLEAAPTAWFQASDTRFRFGARGGLALGVAALRTRGVIPWAGAHFATEHYPQQSGHAAAWFLRGGLRVGFAWDGG